MSSVLSKPDTGENNRTEGAPGCTLGRTNLELAFLCVIIFFLASGGVEGEEMRRKTGGESGM